MAQATTIKFGKCMLLLGDGESSETFAAPCGVQELTMTVNIETSNVNLPDCDDPDLASWLQTDIVSKQMTISGNGVLDTAAMQTWQNWWLSDLPSEERNVRWYRDLTAGQGGGYFLAPAVLTNYEETGQRGQRWTNSFAIALNGRPTFTSA